MRLLLAILIAIVSSGCSAFRRADFSDLPVFVKRYEPTPGARESQHRGYIGLTFFDEVNEEFGGRRTITTLIRQEQPIHHQYGVVIHEFMHSVDPSSGESHGFGRGCYGCSPLQNRNREPMCPQDVGFFRRVRFTEREVVVREQDRYWLEQPVSDAIDEVNAAAGRPVFRLRR